MRLCVCVSVPVSLDWGGTGGIRAFKWLGPKPSQTRKKNTREQNKIITANVTVLRSLSQPEVPRPRRAPVTVKLTRPKAPKASLWADVPEGGPPLKHVQ